ncbi:response regulator transcription factor [Pseudarthrobacter scleromae]|nr:response regulator transcription factor [Pseudarthrobacter scleromae]
MVERGVAVVVEDDDDIRTTLTEVLQQSGFAVHSTASGVAGVDAVREHNPDIVTMDVGLPDFDGIEASRRIRTFSDAYLIIVSGRVDEADTLMGFEAGADDYLTKPFRPRELRARIAAMLRRPRTLREAPAERPLPPRRGERLSPAQASHGDLHGPHEGPEGEAGSPPAPGCCDFAHRGLTLHEASRQASINGEPVDLTRTQFDILLVLMENGRTVQTKADLVRRLRNEPYNTGSFVTAGEERAVEVHLGNLRKRLGDSSQNPRWVETVRGVGYRMTP